MKASKKIIVFRLIEDKEPKDTRVVSSTELIDLISEHYTVAVPEWTATNKIIGEWLKAITDRFGMPLCIQGPETDYSTIIYVHTGGLTLIAA